MVGVNAVAGKAGMHDWAAANACAPRPRSASQSVFWEVPNTTGDLPCPRSGHSFTTLGEHFLLFGGCGRKDGELPALQLHN
jgi:hypothetical protein